ncbi:hypothetical protein BSNK01_14050 [Bacillaceae bacterium]
MREKHAQGALLGAFVGDALGMPVEGWSRETIVETFGRLDRMEAGPLPRGSYTDDTQMMIALAKSLVECQGFVADHAARTFAEFYEEKRGYGRGVTEILRRIQKGVPWSECGASVFPEGSYGNGGAMRVAPLAIMYGKQRAQLLQAAERSARITHAHPLAVQGAVMQAVAVALAYQFRKRRPLPQRKFLHELKRAYDWDGTYRKKLQTVKRFLKNPPSAEEVIASLGNGTAAHESVPTAIYSFLRHSEDFKEAVCYAVNLGGDADTLGAMTGALAGAYLGVEAIPREWLEALENGKWGKDAVEKLAARLAEKWTIAIVSPGTFSVPPVFGSSVEHDIEMVSRVMKAQHHVVVYARKCPQYPRSSKEGNLEYRRVEYRNSRDYLRRVIRDLRTLRPDIIQVENRPQYVPAIRRKFPKTPLVLNMHSLQFASPPYISRRRATKAMRMIDALLTNSRYLQQAYEQRFPFLKGKAYGVHLGIDPSPYRRAAAKGEKTERLQRKYRIGKNDKVLLFVGRIIREKGVHHLIRVLPQVLAKEPNVKLLIVGGPRYGRSGKTRYWRWIQRRARPFSDRVIFTRFISPRQLPYYYQLADVVVTPSVWGEPFCRVNLEAMSAGKPVVSTLRGGIPEVVKNGETGFVVPLRDLPRTLPALLLRLLSSDELRQRFSEAGLRRVQAFTWQRTAGEYLRVYRSLLS